MKSKRLDDSGSLTTAGRKAESENRFSDMFKLAIGVFDYKAVRMAA